MKDAARTISRRTELSAAVVRNDRLFAISKEGLGPDKREHVLQAFRGNPEKGYRGAVDIPLFRAPKSCRDADFEALASAGDVLFAITSHSRNREKQKAKAT